MIRLERYAGNPILKPTANTWENLLVFNPAVIQAHGKVHMLYRAQGVDGVSRLGYAHSIDGVNFERFGVWAYQGGGHDNERLGVEDPRVVEIDGVFWVVYTAVSERQGALPDPSWREQVVKRIRVSAATTTDFRTFHDLDEIVPDINAKNATLFPGKHGGEYWALYRNEHLETFYTHSPDLITCCVECADPHFVFRQRPDSWDSMRTGIGAPPIETEYGWLLFYHGVDEKGVYRLGVLLLDKDAPHTVLWRSPEPVLEPEEPYEKQGFIPNVVFTCGALERDDRYFVYYGAADQVIGLASIPKADLIAEIRP